MNKEGIMIYLVMKGQDKFVEKVKAYFQKSLYLLEVIVINDWQDELSFESKTKALQSDNLHFAHRLRHLISQSFSIFRRILPISNAL